MTGNSPTKLLTEITNVRFQVPTAASLKVTAFLDVVPCRLAEVNRRIRRGINIHRPDDGGSTPV
jgi:hypothetical protein